MNIAGYIWGPIPISATVRTARPQLVLKKVTAIGRKRRREETTAKKYEYGKYSSDEVIEVLENYSELLSSLIAQKQKSGAPNPDTRNYRAGQLSTNSNHQEAYNR